MSDIAIKVDGLGKKFFIGNSKVGDLRGDIVQRIKRLLGSPRVDQEAFWALKDILFEIKKGEAVGIIGKNGAGKSTLLKILSRITDPTTGRFEIDGSVSSLLEVGTGFHQELTGRENVYLNGTILGMKRAEIKRRFDEIIDFSGVEKFIDTPVKHYSSGMKVRLAFSVAAHLEPEILIVDEVLAVGDAEFQKKCMGKMDAVSKNEGRTILFVSHNMGALKSLCSKGILIKNGMIEFKGEINATIETYLKETTDSEQTNCVRNYTLNEGCLIEEFLISYTEVEVFGSMEYRLTIRSKPTNRISEMALLFYTEHEERVAIIDLRKDNLHKISEMNDRIIIQGKISDISLVEGKYGIGLYMASNSCTGNFLDVIKLNVTGRKSDLAPYPVNVRGFVELRNQFTIYA